MGNSLGDYIIERYSSSDIKNIKWTKKNPKDTTKTKKKKPNKKYQNSSASECKIKQEFKRPGR